MSVRAPVASKSGNPCRELVFVVRLPPFAWRFLFVLRTEYSSSHSVSHSPRRVASSRDCSPIALDLTSLIVIATSASSLPSSPRTRRQGQPCDPNMSSPYPPPNSYQPNGYYEPNAMPQHGNYGNPPQQSWNGNGNGNGYNNGYNAGYDQQQAYQQQQNVAAGMGKHEQQQYQPQSAGMDGKFDDVKPK